MDALDIFYKISAGAKFSKKNKKAKPTTNNIPSIKTEPADNVNNIAEPSDSVDVEDDSFFESQMYDSNCELEEDETELLDLPKKPDALELLKGMPATDSSGEKEKKKKKKEKKVLDNKALQRLQNEKLAQIRNKLRISVTGANTPWPIEKFEDLTTRFKVSPVIIENLTKSGFTAPTPIQAQAIPTMMEGRQVLCCAPTGSGKTVAFLIPLFHHLKKPKNVGYRCVIVCPTRELAKQTYRESLRLSEGTGLRINIISKVSHVIERFNPNASKKFDILISTPNRLVYLLNEEPPRVELKNVEWLIVDECDRLFEAGIRGFRDQLAVIYNACDSSFIKRGLFSATHSPVLAKWCRKNLKNLVSINVGVRNSAVNTVKQQLLFVGNESGKLVALRNLIQQGLTPPVLIFVQSKERAQELFDELVYDGINVDVIHSDRTQKQRDNVIRCFREGKIWVLICTELMGRGIDFKGVNLIVNYDFPPSAVSYIHRIGRTGRAGREGRAITYFTEGDTTNLRSIATLLKNSGCEVPDYMLSLRKPNKRDKKKLEQRAPHRDSISTTPIYEKEIERKRRKALKGGKKAKKQKLLTEEEKKQ